jgi:hypothetical protein
MHVALKLAAVTFGMLAAVACAKQAGAPAGGAGAGAGETTMTAASLEGRAAACDTVASRGTCSEYRGREGGRGLGFERTLCESTRGDFGRGGCPEAGRIARCELPGGEVKRYYGKLTLAEARADCAEDSGRGAENGPGSKGAFVVE